MLRASKRVNPALLVSEFLKRGSKGCCCVCAIGIYPEQGEPIWQFEMEITIRNLFLINFHNFRNETKAIIADLTLKSIDTNSLENTARSLDNDLSLGSNETEEDSDMLKWEKAIRDTLAVGKVGNLNVDPEFLVFQPIARKYRKSGKSKKICLFN